MKKIIIEKKAFIEAAFFLLFLLILCFTVDEENFLNERIVVPYISIRSSLVICLLTAVAFLISFIKNNSLKISRAEAFLWGRTAFFVLSTLCMSSEADLKWGTLAAVVIAPMTFYIAKNIRISDKAVSWILCIFALVISGEIFYTAFYRNVNFFSPELKWFMFIPVGQTNSIGTILIPMFISADTLRMVLNGFKKRLLLLLQIIVALSFLYMGSRSSQLVLLLYIFSRPILTKTRSVKNKVYILLTWSLIVLLVFLLIINFLGVPLEKLSDMFSFSSLSANRLKVYKDGLKVFGENWLLGRGAYEYQAFDANYAHNFVLEGLIRNGITGCIFLFGALYFVGAKLKREYAFSGNYYYIFVFMLIKTFIEPGFYLLSTENFIWLLFGIGYGRKKVRESYDEGNSEIVFSPEKMEGVT